MEAKAERMSAHVQVGERGRTACLVELQRLLAHPTEPFGMPRQFIQRPGKAVLCIVPPAKEKSDHNIP